jgi:hypothetical protein
MQDTPRKKRKKDKFEKKPGNPLQWRRDVRK